MSPYHFILLCLAGWINRDQQAVIGYLQEEFRILKEMHGRRPQFNDRRRLAAKAKKYDLVDSKKSPISRLRRHFFGGSER